MTRTVTYVHRYKRPPWKKVLWFYRRPQSAATGERA